MTDENKINPAIYKTLEQMKAAGATDQELETAYKQYLSQASSRIDIKTGAPKKLRALMGNQSPQTQLATLKKFYPDAKPYGDDNFVYTDPKTGKVMLANPKGLDLGDVAEYGRMGAQTVSGVLGGAVGSLSGPLGGYTGIGLGESIGGQLYDLTMNTLGREDTRKPMDVVTQATSDALLGSISTKAMDKALPVVTSAGKKAIGGLMYPMRSVIAKTPIVRSATRNLTEDPLTKVDLFEKHNFIPEIGMVTDSDTMKTVSQSMRKSPGSGFIYDAIDQHNYQAGKSLMEKTVAGFGVKGTKAEIGAQTRSGAKSAKKVFEDTAKHLYDEVETFIGKDELISAPKSAKAFADLMETIETFDINPHLYGKLKSISQSFVSDATNPETGGKIAYDSLKKLKSRFGRVFKKSSNQLTDLDYEYKKLWRALQDDIGAAAERRGGGDALAKANAWWIAGKGVKEAGEEGYLETIEEILKQSENGKIYNLMTKEMPFGAQKLMNVFRQMPKGVQDNIRASVLWQAGKANPGMQNAVGDTFSFGTFLTNMNKMSPEAKTFLFGHKGQPTKDLKDLMKISEYMKALEKHGNFSNTSHVSIWKRLTQPFVNAAMLGGAGGYAGGGMDAMLKGAVVAGGIGAGATITGNQVKKMQAKLLTDPKFIRWLAKTANDAIHHPELMHKNFARLPIMAQNSPENREEIRAYIHTLGLPYRIKGGRIEGAK